MVEDVMKTYHVISRQLSSQRLYLLPYVSQAKSFIIIAVEGRVCVCVCVSGECVLVCGKCVCVCVW